MHRFVPALLSSFLVASACGPADESSPGELYVVLDIDEPLLPTTVAILTFTPGGGVPQRFDAADFASEPWPRVFRLTDDGSGLFGFSAELEITRAGVGPMRVSGRGSFVAGEARVVRRQFRLACADVACDTGTTCGADGVCSSDIEIPTEVYDPETVRRREFLDAGMQDASVGDAGFDAGGLPPELELLAPMPGTEGGTVSATLRTERELDERQSYVLSTSDERLLVPSPRVVTLTPEVPSVTITFAGPTSPVAHASESVDVLFDRLVPAGSSAAGPQVLGQIGYVDREQVVELDEGASGRAVALGEGQACVIRGGSVSCWGDGAAGRPGDARLEPIADAAGAIADAVILAVGDAHACALRASGAVACWGDGARAQLAGAASSSEALTIDLGLGAESVVDLLARGDGTCALTDAGGVLCWGDGVEGRFGGAAGLVMTPRAVFDGFDATSFALADESLCAAGAMGVRCVGSDAEGQSALGSLASSAEVSALVAGHAHYCAIVGTDANVHCWGRSLATVDHGADEQITVVGVPLSVETLVAAGDFTCGQRADGLVQCWGLAANGAGERGIVGAGRATNRIHGRSTGGGAAPDPRQLPLTVDAWPVGARLLAAGGPHFCGVDLAGKLFCVGPPTSPILRDGWSGRGDALVAPALRVSRGGVTTLAAAWQPVYRSSRFHPVDNLAFDVGPRDTCIDGREFPQPACWGPLRGDEYTGYQGTDFDLSMTAATPMEAVDTSMSGLAISGAATIRRFALGPHVACYVFRGVESIVRCGGQRGGEQRHSVDLRVSPSEFMGLGAVAFGNNQRFAGVTFDGRLFTEGSTRRGSLNAPTTPSRSRPATRMVACSTTRERFSAGAAKPRDRSGRLRGTPPRVCSPPGFAR